MYKLNTLNSKKFTKNFRSSTLRSNQTSNTLSTTVDSPANTINNNVIQQLSHFELQDSSDEEQIINYTTSYSTSKSSSNNNNNINQNQNQNHTHNHSAQNNITGRQISINKSNKGNTHSGPTGTSNANKYGNNLTNGMQPLQVNQYGTYTTTTNNQNTNKKYRSGIRSAPGSDNGRSTSGFSTTSGLDLFNLCGRGLIRRIKYKSPHKNQQTRKTISKGIGEAYGFDNFRDVEEFMSSDSDESSTGFGVWTL